MKINKLIKLYQKADKIYTNNSLDWKEKYDKIFSEKISQKVSFEYYNPDRDYDEDTMSFMTAFKEHVLDEIELLKKKVRGY